MSFLLLGATALVFALSGTKGLPKDEASPNCCSQNPPGGGGGSYLTESEVVKLKLGEAYTFLVDGTSAFASGGTWSAKYGSITSGGVYTAPSFVPPSGLDTVSYADPNGLVAEAHVAIEIPTGITPESATVVPAAFFNYTNYFDTTPTPGSADPGEAMAMPVEVVLSDAQLEQLGTEWLENADALDSVPTDGKWHPFILDGQPYVQDQSPLADCIQIVPGTVNGSSAFPVTTYLAGSSMTGLALLATTELASDPPRVCKTGPLYGPPSYVGDPCSNPGEKRYVYGPLKQFVKRGQMVPGGSITVTAAIKADVWKIFKIELTINSVINVNQQLIEYQQIQNYDVYKCVNGVWKYDGSGTCIRLATGLVTIPIWAAWVYGYPSDGGPGKWSPWSCHRLP